MPDNNFKAPPCHVKINTAGILDDHNLSGLECAILCYLRARNAGMEWYGTKRDLNKVFSDSRTAIKNAVLSLKQKGYIEIKSIRGVNGKFKGQKYILNKNPQFRFDSNVIEVDFGINDKAIKTILKNYKKDGTL